LWAVIPRTLKRFGLDRKSARISFALRKISIIDQHCLRR
jgi:hypothetical protein